MNWHEAQTQSPLAYQAFIGWYMKTYPGYSQFEIRGDEEENELVAGLFDVPDSDVCLAEVIEPRDLYDFFDSVGLIIKDAPTGPQNFAKKVFIDGYSYSMYATSNTRKEGETDAFEWCFDRYEKIITQQLETLKNN